MSAGGHIVSLEEARNPNVGRLRSMAASGLAEIRIVCSADVARKIAVDNEKIQGHLRDMSVTIVLLLEMLDMKEVHFTQEELVGALPQAASIARQFDKEGGLTVMLPGAREEGGTEKGDDTDVETPTET